MMPKPLAHEGACGARSWSARRTWVTDGGLSRQGKPTRIEYGCGLGGQHACGLGMPHDHAVCAGAVRRHSVVAEAVWARGGMGVPEWYRWYGGGVWVGGTSCGCQVVRGVGVRYVDADRKRSVRNGPAADAAMTYRDDVSG